MKLTKTLISLALVVTSFCANANLVVNGGFETGNFSGWKKVANFTGVENTAAQSGTYGAALGNMNGIGTISQNISTAAGGDYQLSYWFTSDGQTPNYFGVLWNGTQIAGSQISNGAAIAYTNFVFMLVGTGSDTLTFQERNDPGYLGLDTVTLNRIPEPGSLALVGLGIVALGLSRRRSR